jgi:predicted hydrocarbon binding protein
MEDELRISGDNIIHALEFIRRKKGEEGLNWIVCETGQGISDIYPEKMYPLELYIELLNVIQSNFEDTDSTVISRIGYDRAKTLTIFEFHKKKTDPISILKLMQKHWSRFNEFGRFEVKSKDNSSATVYLCDCPANPVYCQRMEGFIKGIITAVCFRKDAVVREVRCKGKGDRYCKFMASWNEPALM